MLSSIVYIIIGVVLSGKNFVKKKKVDILGVFAASETAQSKIIFI